MVNNRVKNMETPTGRAWQFYGAELSINLDDFERARGLLGGLEQ